MTKRKRLAGAVRLGSFQAQMVLGVILEHWPSPLGRLVRVGLWGLAAVVVAL